MRIRTETGAKAIISKIALYPTVINQEKLIIRCLVSGTNRLKIDEDLDACVSAVISQDGDAKFAPSLESPGQIMNRKTYRRYDEDDKAYIATIELEFAMKDED